MQVDKKDWQEKGVGHRQRLRDKFRQHGIESFTDSEVVELLLKIRKRTNGWFCGPGVDR